MADSQANIIQGTSYRRPRIACPKCLQDLPAGFLQARTGVERFGTRCPACSAMLRFIHEDISQDSGKQGSAGPGFEVWVPLLMSDRRSRATGRRIWEPCENAWQSPGGATSRTYGFSDPTGTVCAYPVPGKAMRPELAWEKKLGDDPLVSVTYADGEVWVVDARGLVHIIPDPQLELRDSTPAGVRDTLNLGAFLSEVRCPPIVRGPWWFFLGKEGRAAFVYRNERTNQASSWPTVHFVLSGASWKGVPLAIDRSGHKTPLFAAVAVSHEDDLKVELVVFELPADAAQTAGGGLKETARVPLPRAINVPVQVPLGYITADDNAKALLSGHLVWVDDRAAVHVIDTAGNPEEWRSVSVWGPDGIQQQAVGGQKFGPNGQLIPPSPHLPSLPPLPPLPPIPGSAAASIAGAMKTLPPLPVAADESPTLLQRHFEDSLCITVEKFAHRGDPIWTGGIRLWSIQREELNEDGVRVRVLALEGGPSGERGWLEVTPGYALRSARAARGRGLVTVSAQPIYMDPPGTEAGRLAGERGQCIVVATDKAVDIYARERMQQPLETRNTVRELADSSVASQPIVTPVGVLVAFSSIVEFWTMDRPCESRIEKTYPPSGGLGLKSDSKKSAARLLHPAVVGNRVWFPSDEGIMYCFNILPEP